MSGVVLSWPKAGDRLPTWLVYTLIMGLYLTVRGYHSFDGDQAYRLPLLMHWQDPHVFADDPFVRQFDTFNPHRGSLVLMDMVTRPLGLSAGLLVIFVLMFGTTCLGIDRLARAVWPAFGPHVGLVAIALVLAAKAGNIGTNHLFEAMVLDRLIAFALGWLAIASVVADPERAGMRALATIGMATWVHPSVGLQLSLLLATAWILWCLLPWSMEVGIRSAFMGVLGLGLAVVPGLVYNLGSGSSLIGAMSVDDFWLLTAELQSPQHMLPHLWRMPQWLAWACYMVLAALPLASSWPAGAATDAATRKIAQRPAAQLRLSVLLVLLLAGLGAAWFGIEVLHQLRLTVFQPFRMATVARGIALVFISGRLMDLWQSGGSLSRMRAILLGIAFSGDWLLVVVALAELAVTVVGEIRGRMVAFDHWRWIDTAAWCSILGAGLNFLTLHDTEFGNRTLLAGISAGAVLVFLTNGRMLGRWLSHFEWSWTPRRLRWALVVAWIVPAAALVAAGVALDQRTARIPFVRSLINRCRFVAVPSDEMERLAVWCRDHTPPSSRFIGPPGPKTFRLWSMRNLAFNRAGSPYHAAGLADWFSRFQDHVAFHGTPGEFVRAYLADRHGFEMRYERQSDADRAALAVRQGANFVIAAAPQNLERPMDSSRSKASPLELLHVEGHFAVYQIKLVRSSTASNSGGDG